MSKRLLLVALVLFALAYSQALANEPMFENKNLGIAIIDPDRPSYSISKSQLPQSGKICKLKNYNHYSVIVDCYQVDKFSGQTNLIWSRKILANDELSGIFVYPDTVFNIREPFKGFSIGSF
jgi:hypothetical protein